MMDQLEKMASIGIVLPKLFPFPQSKPEQMVSSLLTILEDPFLRQWKSRISPIKRQGISLKVYAVQWCGNDF